MLCENCGTRVSESDINCPVCGAKIERETIKKTTVSKALAESSNFGENKTEL